MIDLGKLIKGVAVMLWALLLFATAGPAPHLHRTTEPVDVSARISAGIEEAIFQLTNDERTAHLFAELVWDETLSRIARRHSDDMLRRFFHHVNPDGESPADRVKIYDARPMAMIGENIWLGSGQSIRDRKTLARTIVQDWLGSPGHRANILRPGYTLLGVGVSVRGREVRATQNLAHVKLVRPAAE